MNPWEPYLNLFIAMPLLACAWGLALGLAWELRPRVLLRLRWDGVRVRVRR
jgi:hypothetical protein